MKEKWYLHNGKKRCIRFRDGNCTTPCPVGFRTNDCNYHPPKRKKAKTKSVRAWAFTSCKEGDICAATYKAPGKKCFPCTITYAAKGEK